MQDYLSELNKEQYEAATTLQGNILVLAGAGSGKTKTLVARVAYMLESGIDPEHILLLTFTNKAASEMKERVQKAVGKKAERITACTFHSFCALFLRRNADLVGYANNYTIIDSPDRADAISMAMQDFLSEKKKEGKEYDLKDFPNKKDLGKIYDCARNNCLDFPEAIRKLREEIYDRYESEILQILENFQKYKKEKNLMDYEDLLYYANKLLSENDILCERMGKRFSYISVDEYQDTNYIQNQILSRLSSASGNLMVVGDDAQSIYAFRYADIRNILTFEQTHANCRKIILHTNYRSTQEILDLANAVMKQAKEGISKNLIGLCHGEKPKLIEVEDCYEEADFILQEIQEQTCSLKDIAVICRSAMQSYILEQKLNASGIPYNKFGGMKFLEQKAVKDILAFLRISVNETDEIAYFRVLQLYPGIGKTYAQKIAKIRTQEDMAAAIQKYSKRSFVDYLEELQKTVTKLQAMTLEDKLDYLLDDYYPKVEERNIYLSKSEDWVKASLYDDMKTRIENAKILKTMAEKYRSTVRFLADLVLDATVEKGETDKLNITTIHSAKGLEYHTVFLMDCIESVTPRCKEGEWEDEEERRCVYVAMTRAKKQLYLMFPQYFDPQCIYGNLSHFFHSLEIQKCMDWYKKA